MKNVTTYSNKEVVDALMAYHKKRMNFDKSLFILYPSHRLEESGSWTVLTEDRQPLEGKKVGWWIKLANFVATGRWGI